MAEEHIQLHSLKSLFNIIQELRLTKEKYLRVFRELDQHIINA